MSDIVDSSHHRHHSRQQQQQQQQQEFLHLSAQDRHNKLVNHYATIKTDFDILRENYRFIPSADDDTANDTWETRLAKRYFSRLYREYAIADLSRYKQGQIGLRWRTEREVIQGLGQFSCGAKGCNQRSNNGLASYEVPFVYKENGEVKRALVKVRVCAVHAEQLNYKKNKEKKEKERKRKKKRETKEKKRKRKGDSSSGDDDSDVEDGELVVEKKRKKTDIDNSDGGDGNHKNNNNGDEFEQFLSGLLD